MKTIPEIQVSIVLQDRSPLMPRSRYASAYSCKYTYTQRYIVLCVHVHSYTVFV